LGPRPQQCEAGAYASFLEQLRETLAGWRFGTAQPRQVEPRERRIPGNENQIRLAISVFRKGSRLSKCRSPDSKAGVSLFKQVRSNLNAVADDAGNTPMMLQLLDCDDCCGLTDGPIEETVVSRLLTPVPTGSGANTAGGTASGGSAAGSGSAGAASGVGSDQALRGA
jgi:hypothetical protein